MRRFLWFALIAILATGNLHAKTLPFTLSEIGEFETGPTLLIIGGIQGDEPGGFNAASLLATHYRVTRGRLWVVPNLNFESIIKRSRGVYGDMNRKFPAVAKSDPDYRNVERIKTIITRSEVDYVFNLHDGSGFYRHQHIDAKHSPRRWGQSIIIDQEMMDKVPRAPLGALARTVARMVNRRLMDDEHAIHVKNTRTREGNREMAKTLTYFAINNGKPAVGLEASKSLPTAMRIYYHLSMLESYMSAFGMTFERDFELTPQQLAQVVDDNVKVSFYDRRLFLNFSDARGTLRFVPLKKGAVLEYEASSPLVAIIGHGGGYQVRYGNRSITRLSPQFFEYDDSLTELRVRVDGKSVLVPLGSEIPVTRRFKIEAPEDYRVNVIGWRRRGVSNENRIEVRRGDIAKRFSVDNEATAFRVELYHGKKFTGMVLMRFVEEAQALISPAAPQTGPSLAYNRTIQ